MEPRPGPLTGDPTPRIRQARSFQEAGQWETAEGLYKQILIEHPNHPAAMCGLAKAAGRLGRLAESVELARRAVDAHPNHVECRCALARQLLAIGEADEAAAEAARAVELDARDPDARVASALCLERCGRLDEAKQAIDAALRLAPNDPFPLSVKGQLQSRLHDFTGARQTLQQALDHPQISPGLARDTWNRFGVVCDRLGDYEAAFRAFERCAHLARSSSRAKQCNPMAQPRMIDGFRAGCTAERLSSAAERNARQGPAPAFLVGFPRSGTTMTEQMLAAHPRVSTSDEQPFFNRVRKAWADLVGGSDDVGAMIDRTTGDHLAQLRRAYWDQARAALDDDPQQTRFIDKLPLNLINLGLINMIFPEAPIIVALRDPRDVCLSCFMQDFRLNHAMIHFLGLPSTARFYAKVMEFYLELRPNLTLPLIEVRYEETVRDPQAQAARMLDHLHLEWDDAVLRFHEEAGRKYVSTPSYAAVSEPIHTRAVARWKNYERFIESIRMTIQPYVEHFGYEP